MSADTLCNCVHSFPLYGEPKDKHFECWTMPGAIVEVTERVGRDPKEIERSILTGRTRSGTATSTSRVRSPI
jgi:hypothetical protein